MSQSSIHSATSAFTPIGHNGEGDCNTQSTQTTRLDKQVASVSRIYDSANALKHSVKEIDDVLAIIDGFTFNGKRGVVTRLKTLQSKLPIYYFFSYKLDV